MPAAKADTLCYQPEAGKTVFAQNTKGNICSIPFPCMLPVSDLLKQCFLNCLADLLSGFRKLYLRSPVAKDYATCFLITWKNVLKVPNIRLTIIWLSSCTCRVDLLFQSKPDILTVVYNGRTFILSQSLLLFPELIYLTNGWSWIVNKNERRPNPNSGILQRVYH